MIRRATSTQRSSSSRNSMLPYSASPRKHIEKKKGRKVTPLQILFFATISVIVGVGFISMLLTPSQQHDLVEADQFRSRSQSVEKADHQNKSNSNSNAAEDDYDDDSRPWLILHVGPHKTATTTIQFGLEANEKTLARDRGANFRFAGHSLKAQDFRQGRGRGHKKTTKNKFRWGLFNHRFRDIHKFLKGQLSIGKNVVISSEFHANRFFRWDQMYEHHFLHSNPELLSSVADNGGGRGLVLSPKDNRNFTAISPRDVARAAVEAAAAAASEGTEIIINGDNHEPLFGFRTKIVVTYRHFFLWLPSVHYQSCKYLGPTTTKTPAKESNRYRPGLVEFIESYLDRLVQYDPTDPSTSIYTTADVSSGSDGGIQTRRCEVVPPDKETSHGSVFAYLRWTSTLELYERVDIFDLHRQTLKATTEKEEEVHREHERVHDVVSDFVCQVLPTASETCSMLLQNGRKNGTNNHTAALHKRASSNGVDLVSLPDKHRINVRARTLSGTNATFLYGGKQPERDFHGRIERWFQQTMAAAAARKKRQTYTKGTQQAQQLPFTRCLGPDSTQRLKTASWNSLLQMVMLARSHRRTRYGKNPASKAYYESLFRSLTPTDHLLLSSQPQPQREHDNDDSWIGPTKAAHDESFDEFFASGKLCEVDIDRLFDNPDFVRFVISSPSYGTETRQQREESALHDNNNNSNKIRA